MGADGSRITEFPYTVSGTNQPLNVSIGRPGSAGTGYLNLFSDY